MISTPVQPADADINFKMNDAYGHVAGDDMTVAAQIPLQSVRIDYASAMAATSS
jgi:hypothetical protein